MIGREFYHKLSQKKPQKMRISIQERIIRSLLKHPEWVKIKTQRKVAKEFNTSQQTGSRAFRFAKKRSSKLPETWKSTGNHSPKTNKINDIVIAILCNPQWATTKSQQDIADLFDVTTRTIHKAFYIAKTKNPTIPKKWWGHRYPQVS